MNPVATPSQWIQGARPRTLPNAIAPVVVGVGAALHSGDVTWWKSVLALAVAVALVTGLALILGLQGQVSFAALGGFVGAVGAISLLWVAGRLGRIARTVLIA